MTRVCIRKLLRARPRKSRYGAPLGATNDTSGGVEGLHLQALPVPDGYGPDGTYWGVGSWAHGYMFAAFTPDLSTLLYVRAKTRTMAAAHFRHEYGATFKVPPKDPRTPL